MRKLLESFRVIQNAMNKAEQSRPDYVVELLQRQEDQWLDFKRAEIKPRDLAPLIAGFANTDGGVVVIGVDDKTRAQRGVASASLQALNDLLETPCKLCQPAPVCHHKFIDIINEKGEPDRLLLFDVYKSDVR